MRKRKGYKSGDVVLVSSRELSKAIAVTVASTGFTLDQLKEQAKSGSFADDRARIAWDIAKPAIRTG